MRTAQKVAFPKNHLANCFKPEVLIADFDTPQSAVDVGMHFVIQHKTFKAGPKKRGSHPRAFINQIAPGQCCRHGGDAFFRAILRVDRFAVGHRRCHARGQAKPVGHLRRGGVEHSGFSAAAGKGASAKVNHQWPVGKYHRVAGLDGMHHHQTGQCFGQRLRQKSGQCSRGCGARLCSGDAGNRDIVSDTAKHHIHRILGKPHGRDDRANMRLQKWTL